MDAASKWEVAFRVMASRPPEFWRKRQRKALAWGIVVLVLWIGVVVWVFGQRDAPTFAGFATFLLVSWLIAWYRFMGILRGAAETRERDAAERTAT